MLSRISDSHKVQCLQSLISTNSWKLVELIKKFEGMRNYQDACAVNFVMLMCTDLNGLHTFVEVALNATDDDSSVATMVSDLHSVGNAVKKLLFQVEPKPCGLNDLVTACDGICSEEFFHHKLQVIKFLMYACTLFLHYVATSLFM